MKEESYTDVIDLSEVNLFGWKGSVDKGSVDALINQLDAGKHLDSVHVYKIDNYNYQLTERKLPDQQKKDGGHKRAIAYSKKNLSLNIVVEGNKSSVWFDKYSGVNINDISLVDREEFLNSLSDNGSSNNLYKRAISTFKSAFSSLNFGKFYKKI